MMFGLRIADFGLAQKDVPGQFEIRNPKIIYSHPQDR
jgi:hypothetical protein